MEKPGFLNTLYYKQAAPADIHVRVVGLNFKDVMLSYGKLKSEQPTLGIEFSGELDAQAEGGADPVPSRVMGIGMNCMAKQLSPQNCNLLWKGL